MSFTIKKVGVLASVLASAAIYSSTASAITVDFTGGGGNIGTTAAFNAGFVDVSSTGTPAGALSQDVDGLGVIGTADADEINGFEAITVMFDQAVNINSITVDDLWLDRGDVGASYQINGAGPLTSIAAVNNFASGSPTVAAYAPALMNVTSLTFFSGAQNSPARGYALRAIDYDVAVAAVPVPAAFWLLGSAMVFLFRKRKVS
ncbi:MAG: hypothetical protein AB8D52_06760 [Gammaproteobacteria bacterium]